MAELKELLNLEYICLRPLGCSKAQGKEKLRGVAGISGKIWSQQRWRGVIVFGKRAREASGMCFGNGMMRQS